MTYEDLILKESVMRRVRFICFLRSNTSVFAFKFGLAAVFLIAGSFFVSITNVFNNMPSVFEVGQFANFFMYAFLKTEIVTQIILLGVLATLPYIYRDVSKVFRGGSRQLASA
jgi:hypothetical protein